MNEFEWRRVMRGLRQPVAPRRDLWDAIDAAIGEMDGHRAVAAAVRPNRAMARRPRRWLAMAGVAASLLLVASAGWQLIHTRAVTATAAAPGSRQPLDPRLAAGAIELESARLELQQAIRQSPGSTALQRLLTRTEQQQAQLQHLARQTS